MTSPERDTSRSAPPGLPAGGADSRRRFLGRCLLALCAVQVAVFGVLLAPPDLALGYPFPGGDGGDWLSCGLALAGEATRDTGRSPLLPLVLAALHRLGLLSWTPLVLQLALAALAIGFYHLATEVSHPSAAFAVGVLPLLASGLVRFSFEVMADLPAAALLTWAAVFWLRARRRPRRALCAGLLGGSAALAQAGGLLLLPACAWSALRWRRAAWREPALWLGAMLLVALPVVGAAWRADQGPGIVSATHWAFLRLHVPPLGFYVAAGCSLLGWPALLLAIAGLALPTRDPAARDAVSLARALALAAGVFFLLLYDYPARRLWLYAAPALALGLAVALDRLPGRARLGAAVATLVVAAWPAPGAASEEAAWVAWPVPTVVARGLPPTLARHDLAAAWRASPIAQAWRAHRRYPSFVPLAAARFRSDDSVVLVSAASLPAQERYREMYGLGNALGKRVKVVPEALLPPAWWGWRHATPAGPAGGGFDFARLRLPGDAGSVLLARPLPASGAPLPPWPSPGEAGPDTDPAVLAADLNQARWVDSRLEGPDAFLAVALGDARGAEWVRLLALLTHTSSLFVLTPDDLARLPETFARTPPPTATARAGVAVWRTRFRAWTVLVARPR